MRVVFLDMDGVLNRTDGMQFFTPERIGCDPLYRVEPALVAMFNAWAADEEVSVVISSIWRLGMSLERFLEVSGLAPELMHDDWRTGEAFQELGQRWRAKEITDWLGSHPEVKSWVALDDVDLNWGGGAWVPLVQTDPWEGLKFGDLLRAGALLERQERRAA